MCKLILAWVLVAGLAGAAAALAQPMPAVGRFNGLEVNLGNLHRLSSAQTRSISPENFSGEKGKAGMATEGTERNAARDLGQGWKISPSVRIKAKSTFTLAEMPLEDDIASVAYWYQAEPHAKFPSLPKPEELVIGPLRVVQPKPEPDKKAAP